ncbi:MAG: antitoxin family protein [Chloroflexi bacterium]|nr:antitoxin family protein [Chloroflexota bacterium]
MEFREEYDAVYENGVFKPDGPVNLPEKARVRVRAGSDPSPKGSADRLRQRMSELRAAKVYRPGLIPWTREQINERY